MNFPKQGENYRARLSGGPLDGQIELLVSAGGINREAEFNVSGHIARYVSTGVGHDADGLQTWRYVHDE